MSEVELGEEIVRAEMSVRTKLVLVAVLAGSAGAAAGFFGAKKLLKDGYADLASVEIEEAKHFYQKFYAPKPSPEEVSGVELQKSPAPESLERAVGAMQDYAGGEFGEQQQVTQVRNIFKNDGEIVDEDEEAWDMEKELRSRTEDAPYIINEEEFLQGEKNYEQISVTYFEEDETLVDSADSMIPDKDEKVGDHNLAKMGHGSNDPNKLYVRNDVLEVEFEIARSLGSYAKEVLGFEHSDHEPRSRRRRQRFDDDERSH